MIEFGHIGTHLGTRFAGASVREKILADFDEVERFVFDFSGVETVSNSFADECFAKLIFTKEMSSEEHGLDIDNATGKGYADGVDLEYRFTNLEKVIKRAKLVSPNQLPPIIVDPVGKIIDGNNRYNAIKFHAKLKTVNVIRIKESYDDF